MKRKFENVEIISSLRSIMERNTRAYKEDFEYDVEKLLNCSARGEKWFMWMSREHGTYCFCERDVWLEGTPQNIIWKYYADNYQDGVRAYLVEVKQAEKKLLGSLYELDYQENVREIQKGSFPVKYVDFIYQGGIRREVFLGPRIIKDHMDEPDWEYGLYQDYRLLPENIEDYLNFLRLFHYKAEKETRSSDFHRYIQSLHAA